MPNKNIPMIYGFNKTSEACPDNFSPSLFLGGCNLSCDYCMNSSLLNGLEELDPIDINTVKDFVLNEQCKWVHISGGEITIHDTEEVLNLIERVKSWGCKVSISTNGFESEKLKSILDYIDHVTMDVKTGESKYNLVFKKRIGIVDETKRSLMDLSIPDECINYDSPIDNIKKSLKNLYRRDKSNDDFSYEIRTTLYRPLVGEGEIIEIGRMIGYPTKWVLQPFRKTKSMLSKRAYNVEEYTIGEIDKLLSLARKYNNKVSVKYV